MIDRGGNGMNGDGTWPQTDGRGCAYCGATGGGGHGGGCPNTVFTQQQVDESYAWADQFTRNHIREPQIIEREAAIVEALRGGKMTTPGIASALWARQQPGRSAIAMVTQSLRVLERDGIVRRVDPLMCGRTHWELT
jgi:hypothetical protein